MGLKHVNAVVVGAGAGGGIVAKELATAGLSVVLLERGKWHTAFECRKDDLRNQRTWVLGNAFGPVKIAIRGCSSTWKDTRASSSRATTVTTTTQRALVEAHSAMGRWPGASWSKISECARPTARLRAASLDDWPISYQDLEPYYEKAEWEIGVSGDDSNNIFRAPRRRPLPMPPLPGNREYQILKPAAQRLGLHPFDIPMLRNSVPYNGRGPCMRCRWCVGFACEVDAKNGTHNTVIPAALATGNCELRTQSIVKEILVDSRGLAKAVAYFDANDRLQEQTADLVVVSGSANESARLLLNSKSRLFPGGLGNRYDWVGRNLQGHGYTGALGLFDFDVFDDIGPGPGVAVCDFNHGNKGFISGGLLTNEFVRLPYQFRI